MFGLFKTKQPDKNEAVIAAANNIACTFSGLIASDGIQPGRIYDVSILPFAKDLIMDSCKVWISVCQDSSQLQGWKVVFPILSQFQEGVGSTPLGLDGNAMVAMKDEGLSVEEMARRITQMKMPSPELQEKVNAEHRVLFEWVTQVVDIRPGLTKIT